MNIPSLFSRRNRGKTRTRQTKRSLELEMLEPRQLMAVTWSLGGGELNIIADQNTSNQVYVIDMDPNNSPYVATDYLHLVGIGGNTQMGTLIHKSAVHKINFWGSSHNDVYYAATGIGYFGSPIGQFVDGFGGNDIITTGMGRDTVHGGYGKDVINSRGGNDNIYGGAQDDEIRGGHGNDYLYGGFGDDWIYGDTGSNWIEGNGGHDHLFSTGGSNTVSHLIGGAGRDGLYGGEGSNLVFGGSGADRFLLPSSDLATFVLPLDFDNRQDVILRFENAGSQTVQWATPDGTDFSDFSAGTWTVEDIAVIDSALGEMARATGNNALLRKPSGDVITMYRHGSVDNTSASGNFVAYNSGGDTYYADQNFGDEDWTHQVVFHEFGHNWDTAAEIEAALPGKGDINDVFRSLSDWKADTGATPAGYSPSQDGNWWYLTDSDFVRDYGTRNPLEDWATSFAAYFMEYSGRTFSGTSYAGSTGVGIDAAVAKGWVVAWLNISLNSLGINGPNYGSGGGKGTGDGISGSAISSSQALAIYSATNAGDFGRLETGDSTLATKTHEPAKLEFVGSVDTMELRPALEYVRSNFLDAKSDAFSGHSNRMMDSIFAESAGDGSFFDDEVSDDGWLNLLA